MFLTRKQKLKKYFSAFVVGVVFLFVLSVKNVSATSSVDVYNKPVNGTLQSSEWNGLLTDFVNTWLPATMIGPLGIGTTTVPNDTGLNVVSPYNYSVLVGDKRIGNVGIPFLSSDAATKGYVDSNLISTINSSSLWGGTSTGAIWNLNVGNVGIGTTTPSSKFTVVGVGSGYLTFDNAAYGGGGSPQLKLMTGPSSGGSAGAYMTLQGKLEAWVDVVATNNNTNKKWMRFGTGQPQDTFSIQLLNDNGSSILSTPFSIKNDAPTGSFYVNSLGYVGIGTTTPLYPFEVVSSTIGSSFIAPGNYFTINKKSTYLNGDPAFGVSQDGTMKIQYGWDDEGGIGFIWQYSNGDFRIGVNGSERLRILSTGNVGIGITNPTTTLDVFSAFNSSIFAGNKIIGGVGIPQVNSDAATKGYVDTLISAATSTIASSTGVGKLVGLTSVAYNGSNNANPGYAYAHNACSAEGGFLAGSHVCTVAEMLNTVLVASSTLPSEDVWVFAGTPGYTAMANDCIARTSIKNDADTYGAIWQGKTVPYPEGRGLLKHCNETARLACCK